MHKFILGNMFASLAAPSLTESMILPELNVEGHFFWKCESVTILVFGKVVAQQLSCLADTPKNDLSK